MNSHFIFQEYGTWHVVQASRWSLFPVYKSSTKWIQWIYVYLNGTCCLERDMTTGVQKVFGEDGAGYAQNIYMHEMLKCK